MKNKPEKSIIETMREIRDEFNKKVENMTGEEEMQYIRESLKKDQNFEHDKKVKEKKDI